MARKSADQVVYARLSADTAITDLVGTSPKRIEPILSAQAGALPRITYQTIDEEPVNSNDGPTGLTRARVQVNCLAASYEGARDLADLVRKPTKNGGFLNGFKGTAGGVVCQMCLMADGRDEHERPADGAAKGIFVVQTDFMLSIETH